MNQARNSESKTHAGKLNRTSGPDLSFKTLSDIFFWVTLYVSLSVESLEFLEILRLLKFEDIITMVRRSVGGATPPSVMVLFKSIFC